MEKVYRKHNSFVEIRRRAPAPDARKRVESLNTRLPKLGLSQEMAGVVSRACGELLGTVPAPPQAAPFTLLANVIEEIGRLTDAELPRYLFYRYRYEVYPERKILDHFPPCLQVEPTSVCNFRCTFCYQTEKSFTTKSNGHMGMMSLDLFKRIIDQAQGNCEAVTLASRGEPLICPDIEDMLAYASGKFLAMKMNTNASILDEAKSHTILQSGISTLVFSADAAEEPAYSQLRVGGKLDKVLANIRHFQEIRLKQYPQSRLITRVSGVKVPGASNLDRMEAFWGEFVDQVAFVNYNPWENSYEAPINDITTPCSDLWRRMFVWWDGCVNPCDVDFKSTLAVGSAKESELNQLWRSSSYMKLREDHLAKRRAHHSPCSRCTVI